jgi:two-component system nitrate/nitrite response regulator NarL
LIRVWIETASAVSRAGLRTLLEGQPEIELADSASDADVLLRDEAPDHAGAAPSVVLSDERSAHDALRSGARAFLPRDAGAEQIIAAIHAVAAGLVAFPADEQAAFQAFPSEQIAEPLTPRELEVLEMLAEGLTNKIIAHHLAISEHTAKFHVNSILAKLNAGTRTEAVMRGIRLGLVKV